MIHAVTPERSSKWPQQGIQLPPALMREFKGEAAKHAQGVKRLGSASIAVFLGMPPRVRQVLMLWVEIAMSEGGDGITPEAAWTVFEHAMQIDKDHPTTASWFAKLLASARPKQTLISVHGEVGAEDRARREAETPTHRVDRILDPNLTLPPKQRRRRKAE